MSVEAQIKHSQEVMAEYTQKIQNAMVESVSGEALMQASQDMAQSQEMVTLMQYIEEKGQSEEEKFLMGRYMGQLLQEDPANGLVKYSEYLNGIANDENYVMRKDYYLQIAEHALALHRSEKYVAYIDAYKVFEEDKSEEADKAREVMDAMSQKMQEVSEQ